MNHADYFSDKVKHYISTGDSASTFSIASELERKGNKIYHLEIGMPDFDTPDSIKKSAIASIEKGDVHYTPAAGSFDLRKAISERIYKDYNIYYDPDSEILITAGASEALYLIWTTFLNSNDEVLIPSPYYYSYGNQITSMGSNYVEVPTLDHGQISYDISKFKNCLTKNSKMLILNSPNNPTGYVATTDELRDLAEFSIENDLIVISDECYEKIQYEGEFDSISRYPNMRERTLIINSTSKTFSMTGWRVGYILGDKEFISILRDVHEDLNICPTSFAQEGAVEAYKGTINEVETMFNEYRDRREYILDSLKSINEISFYTPKGAFYIFFDVSKLNVTGSQFCMDMLTKYGVALTPGISFGSNWNNYVRMSYCASLDDIKASMNLIKEYISTLK